MFWTIDRFEEDFAVLMDDNGVCRSVPRDRLPEQVRQGEIKDAKTVALVLKAKLLGL